MINFNPGAYALLLNNNKYHHGSFEDFDIISINRKLKRFRKKNKFVISDVDNKFAEIVKNSEDKNFKLEHENITVDGKMLDFSVSTSVMKQVEKVVDYLDVKPGVLMFDITLDDTVDIEFLGGTYNE